MTYELLAVEYSSELTGTRDLGHQGPQATKRDVNVLPEMLQAVLLSQLVNWILHKVALV